MIVGKYVHPKAQIWGDVKVGEGTIIEPFCVIHGPVIIGENNRIQTGTVIGCPAEHRTKETGLSVIIGDDNIIGPHCVITGATDIRPTQIGDGNMLMSGVHISHDCIIGDGNTLSHKVILAGECNVMNRVNMGSGSMAHQGSVIGSYSMIGMGSVVVKDICPYLVVCGNPAKFLRINIHHLKGYGWNNDNKHNLELFHQLLKEKEPTILNEIISFHELAGNRGKDRIIYFFDELGISCEEE
jgi:UDP-N-acetylglucosamine acyltransferase